MVRIGVDHPRRDWWNGVGASALVVLLVTCTSACSSTSGTSTARTSPVDSSTTAPLRQVADVVLVGDSIGEQIAPYLQPLVAPRSFAPSVYGGTAPCDWLQKELPLTDETVVVFSFIGNSLTPCMDDGAGGHLTGRAVVDRYRADITTLATEVRDAGARVLLVGQPARGDSEAGNDLVDGLNEMYAALATELDVGFVDAGASIEHPDGSFAESLPCETGESCGPAGTNVVRNDDGLHLCPGPPDPVPCAVYSSGAHRFATAIADAINTM